MPSARILPRLVLVLTLVVSTQGLLLVQGTFVLRQDYVASVLCVNRFNPDSDCSGKCYLKQQMEHHAGPHQSHHSNKRAPALLQVALSIHALIVESEGPKPAVPTDANGHLRVDDHGPEQLWVYGVFHPPRIG